MLRMGVEIGVYVGPAVITVMNKMLPVVVVLQHLLRHVWSMHGRDRVGTAGSVVVDNNLRLLDNRRLCMPRMSLSTQERPRLLEMNVSIRVRGVTPCDGPTGVRVGDEYTRCLRLRRGLSTRSAARDALYFDGGGVDALKLMGVRTVYRRCEVVSSCRLVHVVRSGPGEDKRSRNAQPVRETSLLVL